MSSARELPFGFKSASALTSPSSGRAFGTPFKSNVRRQMRPEIDSRAYLFAPLFAPTLHVLLVPLWVALRGQSEAIVQATLWQVVAWFALEAVCLATLGPLLWLLREHILRVRLIRRIAWGCAALFAAASSYALFGASPESRSAVLSWFAALVSATFAFSAINSRHLNAPIPATAGR